MNTAQISNADVADVLDETARLLELQGANTFRVGAYRRAAAGIRAWPEPLAAVYARDGLDGLQTLPGVGESLAKKIGELVSRGHLRALDRLRHKQASGDLLLNLPSIGPRLAERIRGTLGIQTLEDVFEAAEDGRLARIDGLGRKRVRAIRESLAVRLGPKAKTAGSRRKVVAAVNVGELLDIDREYRHKARKDQLLRVAPRRFNPTGAAWLPILRTVRNGRRYTAHFANTARSHHLGREHDWVTIVCESKPTFGQWTIMTATSGPSKGRRVVRGREAECRDFYAGRVVQLRLPKV